MAEKKKVSTKKAATKTTKKASAKKEVKAPAKKTVKAEVKKAPAKKEIKKEVVKEEKNEEEVKKEAKVKKEKKECKLVKWFKELSLDQIVIGGVVIIAILLIVLISVSVKNTKTKNGKDIVAKVNGKTITADELYSKLKEQNGKDITINIEGLTNPEKRTLQTCLGIMKEEEREVILVTNNLSLQLKAKFLGIKAESFKDEVFPRLSEQYTGRENRLTRDDA